MTISRSLNFSLFQSSSGNAPKEEAEDDDEDEDYDWGEYDCRPTNDQSDVSDLRYNLATSRSSLELSERNLSSNLSLIVVSLIYETKREEKLSTWINPIQSLYQL